MTDVSNVKIPLPNFLKILTSHNVPPTKAMVVAGKVSVPVISPFIIIYMSDAMKA
jgi:hypothetical protein